MKFTVKLPFERLLAAILLLILIASPAFAGRWAFTVIGDNRSAFSSYRNVLNEIRTQSVNPGEAFPPFDFILACGDLSPVEGNYLIYKEIFKGRMPTYFPVRGNHELPDDVRFLIQKILLPYGKSINRPDEKSINYYADWKNVRLIVLDQYSDFGKSFSNNTALKWVENALKTPNNIRHVFVAFHEPYLPDQPERDPFWSLLGKNRNKVSAVFAGHTHSYHKQRFPDSKTGIFYINSGNAGWITHSDNKQTIVEVLVEDEKVAFRVVQAPNGTTDFELREEWEIKGAVGDRSQSDLQSPPVFVKVGGNFAEHYVVPRHIE